MIEADMHVKIKVDSLSFVYGVNGGRRFSKSQIKLLNKESKALIGDSITIINRFRLQSNSERVNAIDVTVKNTNKLEQGVDLSFTGKSNDSDDDVFSNLHGSVDLLEVK